MIASIRAAASGGRAVRLRQVAAAIAMSLVVALATTSPGLAATSPGVLNSGFGSAGIASFGTAANLSGGAFQSDGSLVVTGGQGLGGADDAQLIVARLTPSGSLDPSFGTGGVAAGPVPPSVAALGTNTIGRADAVQSNGDIVVAGTVTTADGSADLGMLIERFSANGTLDTSFGSGGVVDLFPGVEAGSGDAVALQPNGDILVAGSAAPNTGEPHATVVRLTPTGALDPSFGTNGSEVLGVGENSVANAIALEANGEIALAGASAEGETAETLIAQLTATGAPDTGFAGQGYLLTQYNDGGDGNDSAFNAVAIQANGEIVAAGDADVSPESAAAVVARFAPNGTPDAGFGNGGVAYQLSAQNVQIGLDVPGATGVTVTSNGDLVATGTANDPVTDGLTDNALWAFTASGAPDTSFGGSGTGTVLTPFPDQTNPTNAIGNALAQAPDGELTVIGEAAPLVVGSANQVGLVAAYDGFGPAPVTTGMPGTPGNPGGTPLAPPPTPTPALRLTLGKLAKTDPADTFLKHGLSLKVGCNEACRISVTLEINAATARQLKLKTTVKKCTTSKGHRRHCTTSHVYRAITLLTSVKTLKAPGTASFTLKLKHTAAVALGKARKSVKLSLVISAKSTATGKTAKLTRTVTIKPAPTHKK